ncbi:MAG: N-acetyltransferase [Chloroflexi bacterium]|nr:N-acetyltransferase [Chloroflexota bacterium]
MAVRIHPTSDVAADAVIGDGTAIWLFCQVRPGAHIGKNCNLGKGVYIDNDVQIGDNVKIQNNVSVYHGVTLEDGVFAGPHVCFTNDMRPRAVNPDLSVKSADDCVVSKTLVKKGAGLGANSTIRCGITIGEWAMVGSGSVVTHDVPAYALVYGNPARIHGFVCACGEKLNKGEVKNGMVKAVCPECKATVDIPLTDWEKIE